ECSFKSILNSNFQNVKRHDSYSREQSNKQFKCYIFQIINSKWFLENDKFRNTKYPLQRAVSLVEAISRDLQAQLLKVLGSRRLMHIAMPEFDLLMNKCFEVFKKWDDEHDK